MRAYQTCGTGQMIIMVCLPEHLLYCFISHDEAVYGHFCTGKMPRHWQKLAKCVPDAPSFFLGQWLTCASSFLYSNELAQWGEG